MSQNSALATSSTTPTTTATTTSEESSSASTKPGSSSLFASLKKHKNKNAEVPLTDDFVVMSAPEKFKDTNIDETNAVVKRHRTDSSPNEKVNLDCLLLSDTSLECGVPVNVQTLLKHFDNSQLQQAEILFLLVYIVSLEAGFVAANHYGMAKLYLHHLSSTGSFHAKNILHLSHLKPSFSSTEDKTRFSIELQTLINVEIPNDDYIYALLTGLLTGDFLIITLSPAAKTAAKGFSVALSISRYVLMKHTKHKPLHQRFRKMDELSYILNDQLFGPIRCQHLSWLECSIYPTLNGLPMELYDYIFKYLNKNELNILANVNKSFLNIVKSSKKKTGRQKSGKKK